MLSANSFLQRRHLHGGQRRFQSFVPHLQSSTIDSLLQRVACKHTESVRNAGLLRRLPNAARDLIRDHIVMSGIPAQQTAQADDGIVFLRFG